MKRFILILLALSFFINVNGQIEEFIQNYKDTSEVYAKWLSIVPSSVNNIPNGVNVNFHFEITQEVKTNGNLSYVISDDRYNNTLDSTRIKKNLNKVERNSRLDSIATERAIRMANLLVDSNGVFIENPSIFNNEAHSGDLIVNENAHLDKGFSGGKAAGLFSYPIGQYPSSEASLAALYSKMLDYKILDPNIALNNSTGHYNARTNPEIEKFGYCILVVECKNTNGTYKRIIITYETFDLTPYTLNKVDI